MRIACEKCGTAYDVDASQIPATGMSMKCTVCFHSFTILPPGDPSLGIELSDTGAEMQLTNDPTDIPQAPQGYIDPTTAGLGGAGGLTDLPGLPSQSPSNDLADLPGLPSQRPAGGGLADLPGLPQQGAAPGQQPGGLADLPGLPPQGAPPAQPAGLTDLPGLPQQPAPGPSLPGLSHNAPPAPSGLTDLPGLPTQQPPGAPLPSVGAPPPPPPPPPSGGQELPELTDLPGLPSGGGAQQPEISGLPGLSGNQAPGLTDLPGLPRGAQLPELTDLPGPTGGGDGFQLGNAPPTAGMNYGELSLGEDAGSLDLDTDLPAPADGGVGLPAPADGGVGLPAPADGGVGLPAPADGGVGLPAPAGGVPMSADGGVGLPAPAGGGIDLPAPAGGIDLPAPASGGIGLPAPSGGIGLPAPSGGIDLPAPSGGVDLPAPSGGVDLPAPSGGIDLPAPSGGIDLPAPSGGIDLPTPSEGGLPGGVIDLPAPGGGGGGIDVVAPKPPEEEIIRFEAPEGVEQDIPPQEVPRDEAPDPDAPVDIRERGRLPSKGVLIGAGAGLVALIGGVILILSLMSDNGGKSPGQKALEEGQAALKLDTYTGYREASTTLAQAVKKLDDKQLPTALQAQAQASRVVRFGLKKVGATRRILDPLAKAENPSRELLLARALLTLARRRHEQAIGALTKLVEKNPQAARGSLYLGWAYQKKGALGEAKAAFKRAIAADKTLTAALYGLASIELTQNRVGSAIPLLKQGLAASPKHGGLLLLQASVEIGQGKLDAAEKRLKRVGLMVKGRRLGRNDTSDLHVYRAHLAQKRGETNEARKHYQQALKLNAKSHRAQLGLGKLLLASKKYKEASDHFRSAQTIDPSSIETSMLLAETMLLLGKPTEARDALGSILKRAPKNPRIRLLMGRVEQTVRSYEPALAQYKQAIKLDPKFFDAYQAMARLQLERKKPALAFEALKLAEGQLPKNARVVNAIGEVHLAIREFAQARAKFEQALGLDAKLNLALFNLATTLRAQGKLQIALKKYEQLQKRDNVFPGLDAGLGALYLALKQYKKAAASYDRALRSSEIKPKLRLDAGQAFVLAGQWERALKQANEALAVAAYRADARALRAEARLLEGDLGEALVEITRALSRAKKAQYFVIHARILERLRRLAAAVDAYKEALKLEPKRIDLRLHRARLQVRGGAVREALKELKRIVKQQPNMAEAHLFTGIAYADLSKENEAQAAYQRAIAKNPKLGEAHYRLGRLFDDKRQLPAALKHLQKAAKLGDKSKSWWPDAYFNVGRLSEQRKLKAEAIAAYKKFLEIARSTDANRPLAIKSLKAFGAYKPPED